MTLIDRAKQGIVTDEMKVVASAERVTPEFICRGIANGRIVLPVSPYRDTKPIGIGKGLKTKVNASVGTSSDIADVDLEVAKTKVAEAAGADSIMELSTAGDFYEIRRKVIQATSLSVGSVPLYQAFIEAARDSGSIVDMREDDLFRVTEEQAKLGTNFMAIHTGINWATLQRLKAQGRHAGLCSRGGAFMSAWMAHNEKENPLFSEFDYLLEILKRHEVTLSMGNGMRAGAVHDSTDRAQIQELIINAELSDKAHDFGVQTIVEGPGHIPIDEIQANVVLQKRLTGEKPFYMLGPLVTDVAPGYDNIVAAIGAALSSSYGADFICYVTPAEHLALPYPEDVHLGVVSARIAAHVGDMIKLGDRDDDLKMAEARNEVDWAKQFKVALDPQKAAQVRKDRTPSDANTCTMCGEFCAYKIVKQYFEL
jgi:phosphomethylpyrimidine synthase